MPSKIIKKIYCLLFICLLIVLGLLSWIYFSADNYLRVVFFDVGQGDSALIITPQEQHILIDGGPTNQLVYQLDKYLPFYNRRIDLMILSHPEQDHLEGLIEVIKRYPVKRVLLTGVQRQKTLPDYQVWLKLIDQKKIPFYFPYQTKLIDLGETTIDVFYPWQDLTGVATEDLNDTSIVNKLNFGQFSALFTGDISREIEAQLLKQPINLQSLILKVAHHGSKYSSYLPFFEAVDPHWAVISSGADNHYGHPTKEVLNDLTAVGAQILRTDQSGDIVFRTDGQQIWLATTK